MRHGRIRENTCHSCESSGDCRRHINVSASTIISVAILRRSVVLSSRVRALLTGALQTLTPLRSGDDRFEEALAYISLHELYDEAVSLYKGRSTQLNVSKDTLVPRGMADQINRSYWNVGATGLAAIVAIQKRLYVRTPSRGAELG